MILAIAMVAVELLDEPPYWLHALLWAPLLGFGSTLALAVPLAGLVIWRHRANIARIRAGTEPRIGRK